MTEKKIKNYKKSEFVALIAKKTDMTKENANKSVDAFIDSIFEIIKNGDTINFIGFGKFSVNKRSERIARNPKTGEKLIIKAYKSPKFNPGQKLKNAANNK